MTFLVIVYQTQLKQWLHTHIQQECSSISAVFQGQLWRDHLLYNKEQAAIATLE